MAKAFGAESTTDEVLDGVDLSGKRVLVTGVSAGLGVETVRTLVAHGARPGEGAARSCGGLPLKGERRSRPGRAEARLT